MTSIEILTERMKKANESEAARLKEQSVIASHAAKELASAAKGEKTESEKLRIIINACIDVESREDPGIYGTEEPQDARTDILLFLIGRFGLVTWPDIMDEIGEEASKALYPFMKVLRFAGMVRYDFVPWHGMGRVGIFVLTEKGRKTYRNLFSEEPAVSVPESLAKRYGSLFLGCQIETASELVHEIAEEKGYDARFEENMAEEDGLFKHTRSVIRDRNGIPKAVVSYDIYDTPNGFTEECERIMEDAEAPLIVFARPDKQTAKETKRIIAGAFEKRMENEGFKVKTVTNKKLIRKAENTHKKKEETK